MNLAENLDIRLHIAESGLLYKDVARQMGVSRVYLSRVLKDPLKPGMRERILAAVSELKETEATKAEEEEKQKQIDKILNESGENHILRCAECKYWGDPSKVSDEYHICNYFKVISMKKLDYCNYGKCKEDEHNGR